MSDEEAGGPRTLLCLFLFVSLPLAVLSMAAIYFFFPETCRMMFPQLGR